MFQAQTERSMITKGIVLCGAGLLTVSGGIWTWHSTERIQATATQTKIRTTATVVPSENPYGALRFETEKGVVEVPLETKGVLPVGRTYGIFYEPGNPQDWTWEPVTAYGVGLVWVSVLMILCGTALLALGWISRRRNHRPFWQ